MSSTPFLTRLRRRLAFIGAIFPVVAFGGTDRLGPFTLSAWKVSGQPVLVSSDTVSLPAGTEVSRVYPVSRLAVHLVSRPYFSAEPKEWPGLEIGAASVTFMRDARGGGVVMVGEQTLTLPIAIELDGTGRSRAALDLTITFDGTRKEAVVALGGSVYRVATRAAESLNVAVSAGAAKEWPLELFEITSDAVASTPTSSNSTGGGQPAGKLAGKDQIAEVQKARADRLEAAARLFQQQHDNEAVALIAGTAGNDASVTWDLLVICYQLRDRRDYPTARRVAAIVQPRLETAARQEPSTKNAGRAKASLGSLKLYVLGAPEEAAAAFREALALDPQQKLAAGQLKRLMPFEKSQAKGGK